MTDTTATGSTAVDQTPDASFEKVAPTYSPSVALKNCAWFTGIVAGVHQAMPGVVQAVAWACGATPAPTSPLIRALPYIIGGVLFLVHDWQKVKSKFKWI